MAEQSSQQITIVPPENYSDADELLRAHARWVIDNADHWTKTGKASPGMVSDAVMKNVDLRLKLGKSAPDEDGARGIGAVLEEMRPELEALLRAADQFAGETPR